MSKVSTQSNIRKSNIQWTAKKLKKEMENGNLNFDNAVQRNLVWDDSKKSLLIHSMIYGFAIPGFYFTYDRENDMYDSLDGKQRCNAIVTFMNDEYALTDDTPPVFDEDVEPDEDGNRPMLEIKGKLYSELPQWAQDAIADFSLTIYYFENVNEEDVKEFFRRLNNGKPLTAVELTRVSTPSLKDFQELASHNAVQMVVTDAAKRRFTDENIAMQVYNMVTSDAPDFSTKAFREWAKSVKVEDKIKFKVENAMTSYLAFTDSLSPVSDKKILKSVKTRTHFVCAVYFCYLALEAGMTQEEIDNTLKDFFSGKPTVSEVYNQTVGSGSAKSHSVQTRQHVIQSLVHVTPILEDDDSDADEDVKVSEADEVPTMDVLHDLEAEEIGGAAIGSEEEEKDETNPNDEDEDQLIGFGF